MELLGSIEIINGLQFHILLVLLKSPTMASGATFVATLPLAALKLL